MTPVQAGAAITAMLTEYKDAADADAPASSVNTMIAALTEDEVRLCLGVLLGMTVSVIGVLEDVTGSRCTHIGLAQQMMDVLHEDAASDG